MVVMISRMSTYVKTYQNVYLKYVYCIVGLLYLNKDVNKMKKAGRDLSWKGIDGQVAGSRNHKDGSKPADTTSHHRHSAADDPASQETESDWLS